MIHGQVARRYAKAIVEIGNETNQLEGLVEEVSRAATAYEGSAELRGALDNPLFSHDAKKAVLAEVADRLSLGPSAKNTILLLNDRRRMHALPEIARVLREMLDAKRGVVRAEVISAKPLSADYVEKLQKSLERRTGKNIVLERSEDPALIAGVIARIGDTVYDGSLRGRLHEMRTRLSS